MAKEKFEIVIELDEKDIKRGFAKIQTESKKTTSTIGAQFKSLTNGLKAQFFALGGAFAAVFGAGAVLRNFFQFESSLAEIRTITQGLNIDQQELAKNLANVGSQFGTSAQEQAKSFYQIISAGVTDAAAAQQLLIDANKLAIGGLTDVQTSIDILTSSVNAFGSENLSSSRAADILFGTVRLGKTRVDELASSLGQILPSASALGVSFEDTNAALATLTTRGISTSEAVTQLNAVFTAVLKKQETASKISKEVADAFNLQALQTKGLVGFLRDLDEATGGSEEQLVKLLGRAEGARAIITLAGDDFKSLANNVDSLKNSAGAATSAFEDVSNTAGFQLRAAFQTFSNFLTGLLAQSNGAFLTFAKSIRSGVQSVVGFLSTVGLRFQFVFANIQKAFQEITIFFVELSNKIRALIPARIATSIGIDVQSGEKSLALLRQDLQNTKDLINEIGLEAGRELNDSTILNTGAAIESFKNIAQNFNQTKETIKKDAKELKFELNQAVGTGISNGIQQFVGALVRGENAFSAFAKASLSVFGDLAIQLGQFFIITSSAVAALKAIDPTGGLAFGVALVALGSVLKGIGGGAPSPTSQQGEVTQPGTDFITETDATVAENQQERATEINVNVEGSLVDPRGTAEAISELLTDVSRSNGIIVNTA